MKYLKSLVVISRSFSTASVLVLFALGLIFMGSGVNALNTPTPVGANNTTSGSRSQQCVGIQEITGSSCSSQSATATSSTSSFIKNFLTILSWIFGIIVLIMVIISALLFITSGGDANKVKQAKGTLTYALVGVVLVAIAQIIAHWVINTSSKV